MQMMSKHTINHLLRAIHIVIRGWKTKDKIIIFSCLLLTFGKLTSVEAYIGCRMKNGPGLGLAHDMRQTRQKITTLWKCESFKITVVLTSILARSHLLTVLSQHLSSRRSKMVLPSVDYTAIFIYESQIPHALVWRRFRESIASLPSLCWKLWMVNTAKL